MSKCLQQKALSLFLICTIVSFSVGLIPQKTHALAVVVTSAPTVEAKLLGILNTTSIIAGGTESLVSKEFTFDRLAWLVGNALIDAMSASIVNWINSGFEGDPLFVTDIGAFLRTVELQEIVEFIGGPELTLICDPFELQVRAALELQFRPFVQEIQCSLGDVVDNIEGLLNGDLTQGGLEGWIEVTTKPQNNPHGAFLLAAGELSARTANARANAQFELDIGRGFLSFKRCTSGGAPGSYRALQDIGTDNNCEIVTPGAVIEEQLNKVLAGGQQRLLIADEVNEVIGALIQQLITRVLGGSSGGLSGLSSPSSSGSASYTSQLGGYDSNTISSVRNRTVSSIDAAATNERRYLNVKQSALSAVLSAESRLLDLQSCGADLVALSSTEDFVDSNEAIRYSSNTLSQVTGPVLTRLDSDIEVSEAILAELAIIQLEIANASDPEEISALIADAQSVTTHNEFDIVTAIEDRDRVIAEMDRVRTDTDRRLVECRTTLGGGGLFAPVGGDG